MSLREHVEFLLVGAGVTKEDAGIRAAELAAAPGNSDLRKQVAKDIGAPKLTAMLDDWTPLPSRTIHLWKAEKFVDGIASVKTAFDRSLKQHMGTSIASTWHEATERPKGKRFIDRLHSVKSDSEGVHAVVSLTSDLRIPQEDDATIPLQAVAKFNVEIAAANPNVIRTYGPPGESRKSLRLLMKWLYGVELTPRGSAEYFRPLRFSESDAKDLAKKRKMKKASIVGLDPTNINGKFGISGRTSRSTITELNLTDPVVAAHDAAPRHVRTFTYAHLHPDGFVEKGLISFFITTSPPHISFPWGGSRSAIDALVSAVVDICE